MAKFKGSKCLTGDCGGHKAGYRYQSGGGGKQPHPNAKSFKKGMKIHVQEVKKENRIQNKKASQAKKSRKTVKVNV